MPSFVNFSRYLDANRGTAERGAQEVASGIAQEAGNVEQKAKNMRVGFERNALEQVPEFNPNATSAQMYNAVYRGPASVSEVPGWNDLVNRGQKAQERAAATSNPYGLQALLQQQRQGPYSQRASSFDAGLIGAVGAERFANVRDRYGKLSERLNAMNTQSQNAAAGALARQTQYAGAAKAKEFQEERAREAAYAREQEAKRRGVEAAAGVQNDYRATAGEMLRGRPKDLRDQIMAPLGRGRL